VEDFIRPGDRGSSKFRMVFCIKMLLREKQRMCMIIFSGKKYELWIWIISKMHPSNKINE